MDRNRGWRRGRLSGWLRGQFGVGVGEERLPGVLNRGQRDDVPAEQRGGAPDRQDPDLPLPGRYGQHVVPAMHQPGGKTLYDQAAVLEDAAADTQRGGRSAAVMHVLLTHPA